MVSTNRQDPVARPLFTIVFNDKNNKKSLESGQVERRVYSLGFMYISTASQVLAFEKERVARCTPRIRIYSNIFYFKFVGTTVIPDLSFIANTKINVLYSLQH
jgi:hypothetical protein